MMHVFTFRMFFVFLNAHIYIYSAQVFQCVKLQHASEHPAVSVQVRQHNPHPVLTRPGNTPAHTCRNVDLGLPTEVADHTCAFDTLFWLQ